VFLPIVEKEMMGGKSEIRGDWTRVDRYPGSVNDLHSTEWVCGAKTIMLLPTMWQHWPWPWFCTLLYHQHSESSIAVYLSWSSSQNKKKNPRSALATRTRRSFNRIVYTSF
jgi:hypothetical protein